MTLRVNEIYRSFQGEGPNVGRPTVFVRFVGCNLKCPGWPCDSQHAIDPKLYRNDMTLYKDPLELSAAIQTFAKDGDGICFTGGEVMLQPAQDLECVLEDLKHHTGFDLELFTNGTFRMSRQFRAYFETIVMDWKLPGSGETFKTEQENNIARNLKLLTLGDGIKFTIANDNDLEMAAARYNDVIKLQKKAPPVYVGVVWAQMREATLAQLILERGLPWFLNVQVHKFVWDADARGI